MPTECWKCHGTGRKPFKNNTFKDCTVCKNGHIYTTQKPHKPYRPFKAVWNPPGRKAKYDIYDPSMAPLESEMLTSLCGHFCIYQQEHGHRMTSDDVSTAAIAIMNTPVVQRHLDLGTGLGSVLNIVNWYHDCFSVGVEAQQVNYNLALKTIEFNGIVDKCQLIHSDFRHLGDIGLFDLVTGTPPYFPLNNGSRCVDESRSMCAFEFRGGIEEYCLTAANYLTPNGLFVVANTSIEVARTLKSGRDAGLTIMEITHFHGIEGKQALYCVFNFRKTDILGSDSERDSSFLEKHINIRNADGQFSVEHEEMMQLVGKPPSKLESATVPVRKC